MKDNIIGIIKVTFNDGKVEIYERHYINEFLDFIKFLVENKVQENIYKIEIES